MAAKYKLDWTDLAFEALEEIYEFITEQAQSEAPAKKVVKRIFKSTDILKTNPLSFQEEPFLKEKGMSARYLVVGMYKIIYVIKGKNVIITDVFNCHQHPSEINK
jgi:plasmid stabilization system protein ParE